MRQLFEAQVPSVQNDPAPWHVEMDRTERRELAVLAPSVLHTFAANHRLRDGLDSTGTEVMEAVLVLEDIEFLRLEEPSGGVVDVVFRVPTLRPDAHVFECRVRPSVVSLPAGAGRHHLEPPLGSSRLVEVAELDVVDPAFRSAAAGGPANPCHRSGGTTYRANATSWRWKSSSCLGPSPGPYSVGSSASRAVAGRSGRRTRSRSFPSSTRDGADIDEVLRLQRGPIRRERNDPPLRPSRREEPEQAGSRWGHRAFALANVAVVEPDLEPVDRVETTPTQETIPGCEPKKSIDADKWVPSLSRVPNPLIPPNAACAPSQNASSGPTGPCSHHLASGPGRDDRLDLPRDPVDGSPRHQLRPSREDEVLLRRHSFDWGGSPVRSVTSGHRAIGRSLGAWVDPEPALITLP